MRTIFDPVSLLIGSIRITFLGLAQNIAHDAATITPKSLVLRARAHSLFARSSPLADSHSVIPETRKTYRAVFSEPTLVIPGPSVAEPSEGSESVETKPSGEQLPEVKPASVAQIVSTAPMQPQPKRARDIADCNIVGGARKRKKGNKKSG